MSNEFRFLKWVRFCEQIFIVKWVIFVASFFWLWDFLLECLKLKRNSDDVHWNVWMNIKALYARNNIFKTKVPNMTISIIYILVQIWFWGLLNFSSSAIHGGQYFYSASSLLKKAVCGSYKLGIWWILSQGTIWGKNNKNSIRRFWCNKNKSNKDSRRNGNGNTNVKWTNKVLQIKQYFIWIEVNEITWMKNIKNIEKLKPTLKEMEAIDTKFISYILPELIAAIYTRYIRKSKIKSLLLQLLMITNENTTLL